MNQNRVIQLGAGLVVAGCLFGSSMIAPIINASASSAQIKVTDDAANGAPAAVVIAQSVGVLRGIIVNYLWIRADQLKEDGKFYEAYHLGKWITDLQPHIASVWYFQAWNMAYNISVSTHTLQERWQWVNDGLSLLRNYGVVYNPNNMAIYKELAWEFFHKVGGFTDDANRYYKQQLADEWQGILGEPPYEADARLAAMEKIADAPGNLDDLYAQSPETKPLIEALQGAGFKLNETFLRAVERYDCLGSSYLAMKMDIRAKVQDEGNIAKLPAEDQQRARQLHTISVLESDPKYAGAWPDLLAHVRKRVLLDDYNMAPGYMAKFMKEFGPLDWRSPFAHSLYWAELGVEKGLGRENQNKFDRVNTDREAFFSIQWLTRYGHVYYDFLSKEENEGADLRFIPYYEKMYKLMWDRMTPEDPQPPITFKDGYRNFLIWAVRNYYMYGDVQKAQEYYAKLRQPEFAEKGKENRFTYPLDEFILRENAGDWTSINVAKPDIIALLTRANIEGLAAGNTEKYNQSVHLARIIYDYFMKEIGSHPTAVDTVRGRLPMEWTDLQIQGVLQALTNTQYTISQKISLWERMDNNTKLKVYDQITSSLREQLASTGLNLPLDQAFPPPAGLDAYRQHKAEHPEDMTTQPTKIERK